MHDATRILVLDDDAIDCELVRRALKRHDSSVQVRCVFTEQEYLAELQGFSPDVILSDYKLPLCGGAFALKMARELCPAAPFIFVSGVLQDGLATELLKRGARAYISKSNLQQLGPVIEQALMEAPNRQPRGPAPRQATGARTAP